MVTGGNTVNKGKSVELLSSDGTKLCSLPDLPADRYHHSQTGLVTCGGGLTSSDQKSCYTFSAGRWKKTHTLRQRRYGHTAYALPQGVMLMGGDAHGGFKKTTELLTDNGGATLSINLFNERV